MCSAKSNEAFNNNMFTFGNMTAMHESMVRLYEAARELRGVEGQSAVARLMNQSPQTVKNWEGRGISYAGMIEAERAIGCAAIWLHSGMLPMAIGEAGGSRPLRLVEKATSGDLSAESALSPEALAIAQDYELAGAAKRQAIKQLVFLPDHEMAALILVLQSIGEKYKMKKP